MKRMLISFIVITMCVLALPHEPAAARTYNMRAAYVWDNPIDDTSFYVEQQYLDVLGRASDQTGFDDWSDYINECGTNASCINEHRITTARGFIESPEFLSSHDTLRESSVGSVPYDQEYVRELYRSYLRREPEGNSDLFDNPWFIYIRANPGNYDILVGGFINSSEYRNRFD